MAQEKRERNRASTTICPTCGTRCLHQWSQQLTPLFREITYRCRNEKCGRVFVTSVAHLRDVQPSLLDAANSPGLPNAMAG